MLRIRDAHRLQRKRTQRRERAWVSENQNITKARTRASSPMKTNPALRGLFARLGGGAGHGNRIFQAQERAFSKAWRSSCCQSQTLMAIWLFPVCQTLSKCSSRAHSFILLEACSHWPIIQLRKLRHRDIIPGPGAHRAGRPGPIRPALGSRGDTGEEGSSIVLRNLNWLW